MNRHHHHTNGDVGMFWTHDNRLEFGRFCCLELQWIICMPRVFICGSTHVFVSIQHHETICPGWLEPAFGNVDWAIHKGHLSAIFAAKASSYSDNCLFHDIFNTFWLVVSTPLKNISQLGLLFQILEKIKKCSKLPSSNTFGWCLEMMRGSRLRCLEESAAETANQMP